MKITGKLLRVVLIFELVVMLLASILLLTLPGVNKSASVIFILVMVLAMVISLIWAKSSLGLYLGTALNLALLLSGPFFHWSLSIFGLVFLGLWIYALRAGKKLESQKDG